MIFHVLFIAFTFFAGWHTGGKSIFMANAITDPADFMIAPLIRNILMMINKTCSVKDDSLFISGSHAGIKFRIIHFSAGFGTCYRDSRAKRQSVPKNNLAIKHIDSGGSRNPKAGENRLGLFLDFWLDSCGIQQYVMAEAERIEKKFKYGVEESDQTHFEQYAENWLKRQEPFFKATTYAGYKRNLGIVYPLIGGIPLAKLLPMTLEEMCEELRKRPGRGGNCIKETTVQKYLETISSVLEDAKKNDIIPFNPAHRVRKKHFEKEVQHIPQKYEMSKLMRAIQNEPILYRAYYTLAITTGLRRGELCALQWRDITGACELTIRRSRSCASGQIVESDTKNHRERIVTIPLGLWELLMALRQQQMLHSGVPDREQPIFTDPDGHVPHPDTFTRHLRKLYKQCGLSEDYHLHTLRHFYATYLLQEGTSKQVAASLLGHADTAFLERTYCHPQDVAKRQAANLMQDLLNNQNPCYVAFMKNKNRKVKKAG